MARRKNQVKQPKKELKKEKDNIQEDHDKKLLMFTGVSFFMILIIFVWIFNIKNVFNSPAGGERESKPTEFTRQDWNKMTDEFNKTFGKVRNELDELKSQKTQNNYEGAEMNSDIIINLDDLKMKLEKIGTSTNDKLEIY